MKDLLDILKNYGYIPVVQSLGTITGLLLILSFVPSLNFIPKAFLLYILTPFIFGK